MFWLNDAKNAWQGMIDKGIKPQAVIINGTAGVGKKALVSGIVPVMLCAKSDQAACGECQSCRLNQAGHHPDVLTVVPENNVVKVGMIRQLTEFFVSTPHCSKHKIAVIHQAHLMNNSAANALLKVLEEPPSNVVFIILTTSKSSILPTIYSRIPYSYLKKSQLKDESPLDIKKLDLKDIYNFLKENQKISKSEAKEIIESILLKVKIQDLTLTQSQLEFFSKSIKLLELNSRPVNVLTTLLLSLSNKKTKF